MVELATALPQLGIYPAFPAMPVTTGAAPITNDGAPAVYLITTGGTAGTEIIDLQNPDLPLAGFMNPYIVGQRCVFALGTQTDPGDVVQITAAGETSIDCYPPNPAAPRSSVQDGAILDYEGACVCFVWCGDVWQIDAGLTELNFSSNFGAGAVSLSTLGAAQAAVGGQTVLIATFDGSSGNDPGGDITLQLGAGSGAGRQGSLSGGLPTADPHVAGVWWSDAGTVKISAG